MKSELEFIYRWVWKARLPHRYRQPCAVVAWGGMNSAMVQWKDGTRNIVSRNALRKQAAI